MEYLDEDIRNGAAELLATLHGHEGHGGDHSPQDKRGSKSVYTLGNIDWEKIKFIA
jgi:hypothetical protein